MQIFAIIFISINCAVQICAHDAFKIRSASGDDQSVFVTLNKTTGQYALHLGPVNPSVLVALGQFREDTNETGWSYVDITAQKRSGQPYNDSERAYASGLAEGYLTKRMIGLHYLNRVKSYCDPDPQWCDRLRIYLAQNVQWMSAMVEQQRSTSPFWHHVGLFMEQLAGIADGVSGTFLGPRLNLEGQGLADLYFSNLHGDIDDLEHVLNKTFFSKSEGVGCSALVKLTPQGDIIAGHATWINYKSMLRIIKNFQIDLHATAQEQQMAEQIKLTSYPGYITSLDDFYMNTQKLVIMDSTLTNYNETIWKLSNNTTVPYAIRGVVASRLAATGPEWHQWFSSYNSGTGNSEWLVVDYKALRSGSSKGILTVGDQMPGRYFTNDFSVQLKKTTYFASYNVPAMPDAYLYSNQTGMFRIYGNYFSYANTARAQIFARNQTKVQDLTSALKLMRFNNFEEDPLSTCPQCNPPYSAALTVASRYDLNDPKGSYPIDFLGGWDSMGATDAKVLNGTLVDQMVFLGQSGPTFDQQPPFRWSTSNMSMEQFPHYGQPDLFQFDAIIYD